MQVARRAAVSVSSRQVARWAAAPRMAAAVAPRTLAVAPISRRWGSSHGVPHEKKEAALPEFGAPLGVQGFEKEELEGKFDDESILTGPFGTRENPVIVKSIFDMRIVGCEGGPGEMKHDLIWHSVREGDRPTVCLECGQFFKLQRIEPAHHGEDHHGEAHH